MINSIKKNDTHFIPGFLIGAFFSALLVTFMAWYWPISTRDKIIEESFKRIHEQAIKLDSLQKQNPKNSGAQTK